MSKYSTVQYSTVQYSTVQYSTVQYSTVQYSTVQYSTVQCCVLCVVCCVLCVVFCVVCCVLCVVCCVWCGVIIYFNISYLIYFQLNLSDSAFFSFQVPSALQGLIDHIDRDLTFALETEHGM